MRSRKIFVILVMTLFIAASLSTTTVSDWDQKDGHKMHYPQMPDPTGWDVYATAEVPGYSDVVLADDFQCSESGYIKDVHIWGSWKGDIVGTIDYFVIGIARDIPASESPTEYSMPGETLKEWKLGNWKESEPIDPPGMQGWYEPHSGEILYNDHQNYYQYNFYLDENEWFYQKEGEIYWLFVSAVVKQTSAVIQPLWGWKSSTDHWNDDAVWAYWYELEWIDLWEPQPGSITNDFWVELDAQSNVVGRNSGGTDYYDDGESLSGWYYYPNTEWWNIWFYDHPFDPDRYKDVYISFYAEPTDFDSSITIAINWATDQWEGQNPPIPPLTETEEARYIGREVIFSEYPLYEQVYIEDYKYTILGYNPEWVSVDVMGRNVIIASGESKITHDCLPKIQQSLDLAFVITGEEEECQCELEIEIPSGLYINDVPAKISNVGNSNCNNISWKITSSNLLGNVSCNSNGGIPTLAPGTSKKVTCSPSGTFGILKIAAEATSCTKTVTDEKYAIILGLGAFSIIFVL